MRNFCQAPADVAAVTTVGSVPWLGKKDDNPNHKARFDYRGNLLLSAFGRDLDAVDTVVDEVRLWEFPDKDGFRELIELRNNENELLFTS